MWNRQIIKENLSVVLAMIFVIFCAWLLGLGANYADASVESMQDLRTSTELGANTGYTLDYDTLIAMFKPSHYNINSFFLSKFDYQGQSGDGIATTCLVSILNHNESVIYSENMVIDFSGSTGGAYYTFSSNIHVNPSYIYKIKIKISSGVHFSDLPATPKLRIFQTSSYGIGMNANISDGGSGYWTGINQIFDIGLRYDTESFDYPSSESDQEVIVLDSNTIFEDGLAYNFFKKNCYLEQAIDCELEFSYSPDSLGVPIYFTYENFENEFGLIATTTPDDPVSFQDSVIIPNPAGTVATGTDFVTGVDISYCVYAISTTTLETYERCGIMITWASDELIDRITASTSYAQKSQDCVGTSTDENFMSHSLKIFGCWALYPTPSSMMDLYDMKEKVFTTFPLNIFNDIQDRIEWHRVNNLLGSSTISTSTHGIYLFFDGQNKSSAKIFGADVIYNGMPTFWTNFRAFLEWFVWVAFVIYCFKKILNLPIFSSEYKYQEQRLNSLGRLSDYTTVNRMYAQNKLLFNKRKK